MRSGVEKPFWRDRVTVTRRTQSGVDPDTELPKFTDEILLENEPCDLVEDTRRNVTPTDAGTLVSRVRETRLRLELRDRNLVPDENDDVVVNGQRYRVEAIVTLNSDPATGKFLGAVLALSAPEVVP